jgi:hypothetical protein
LVVKEGNSRGYEKGIMEDTQSQEVVIILALRSTLAISEGFVGSLLSVI